MRNDRKELYADMTDVDEEVPWEGRLTQASFEFGLRCVGNSAIRTLIALSRIHSLSSSR
jgi:hypothetical protein